MADLEEVFKILADDTTGAGEPAISRIEGEAAAAKEGLIGFSFKDASGNVVLPQLTAEGKIPVDTEAAAAGTCLTDEGENAGSLTAVTLATITGALSKTYSKFGAVASCLRPTRFELVYIDDAAGTPVETILGRWLVGAGQYSVAFELECLVQSTSAGTGTQEFIVRGTNLFKTSTMSAALAVLES